jgi:hypothetical protein
MKCRPPSSSTDAASRSPSRGSQSPHAEPDILGRYLPSIVARDRHSKKERNLESGTHYAPAQAWSGVADCSWPAPPEYEAAVLISAPRTFLRASAIFKDFDPRRLIQWHSSKYLFLTFITFVALRGLPAQSGDPAQAPITSNHASITGNRARLAILCFRSGPDSGTEMLERSIFSFNNDFVETSCENIHDGR